MQKSWYVLTNCVKGLLRVYEACVRSPNCKQKAFCHSYWFYLSLALWIRHYLKSGLFDYILSMHAHIDCYPSMNYEVMVTRIPNRHINNSHATIIAKHLSHKISFSCFHSLFWDIYLVTYLNKKSKFYFTVDLWTHWITFSWKISGS